MLSYIEKNRERFRFTFLPAFGEFLLQHKAEEFSKLHLQLAKEEDLPLLKSLRSADPKEVKALMLSYTTALLKAMASNTLDQYVSESLKTWKNSELKIIDREDIVAKDLTIGAFIRRKIFYALLKEYTNDQDLREKIMEEVDRFTSQHEFVAYNVYIDFQKEKLNEFNINLSNQYEELLEAQELSDMGSFHWYFVEPPRSSYSPNALRILGFGKKAGIDDFMNYVHPDDRQKLLDAVANARDNNGFYECEFRYLRADTEQQLWSRGKVEFDDGRAVSLKGMVRDNTRKHEMLHELTELNKTLVEKNTELQRSNQELESFNYIASHDLQEPLRKIQTFSSRLSAEADKIPPHLQEFIEKIRSSSARMQHLIEDLLDFSQISMSSDAFEPVKLNEVLEEVKSTLSDKIELAHAHINADVLPEITGIPFQLQQLFENLIGNAIKYRKDDEPPLIHISCNVVKAADTHLTGLTEKRYLLLKFEDNGIGFEPEYADKIFDLFKRLHPREKYSGTGIGLAICKKIVQNHQGLIFADSIPGKGSVFYIYLPVSRIVKKEGQPKIRTAKAKQVR